MRASVLPAGLRAASPGALGDPASRCPEERDAEHQVHALTRPRARAYLDELIADTRAALRHLVPGRDSAAAP